MRLLLAVALLCMLVPYAHAANPRYNCTNSCTFVTDAYPTTGPVPTVCKLYSAGALKASSPAVAVAGGVQCQVTATFALGSYSVTMSGVDASGQESPQSTPFVFDSAVPLPAPTGVRITAASF